MAFIYAMVDTWNSAGATFDAIRMSVTDTTSSASSALLRLTYNGADIFYVNRNNDGGWTLGQYSGNEANCGRIYHGNNGNIDFFGQQSDILASFSSNSSFTGLQMGTVYPRIGWRSISNSQNSVDICIVRSAQNVLEVNTGVTASYAHIVMFTNRTVGVTFASLPSATSVSVGGRAMITNGAAATFNTTAAGGGANVVPVFSDGTQWKVG